jgi:hypothetical protein
MQPPPAAVQGFSVFADTQYGEHSLNFPGAGTEGGGQVDVALGGSNRQLFNYSMDTFHGTG